MSHCVKVGQLHDRNAVSESESQVTYTLFLSVAIFALLCNGSTSAFGAECTGSSPVRADSLVLGIVPAGMRFLAVQMQCVPVNDDGGVSLGKSREIKFIQVAQHQRI